MNDARINEAALELLFSDMDSYANWLAVECYQAPASQTRIGYVPREPARFAMFLEVLTAPQLLALSLYPDVQIAGKAMQEMRNRYQAQAERSGVLPKLAVQAQEAFA